MGETRAEVWLRCLIAAASRDLGIASPYKGDRHVLNSGECVSFADAALEAYEARFPTPEHPYRTEAPSSGREE